MSTRLFSLFAVCCLFIAGCGDGGPKVAPVKGKITLKGAPYTKALIIFQPKEGGPQGIGRTDAQGEFSILTGDKIGAILGTHKVTITTLPEPTTTVNTEMRSDDPAYAAQANSKESDYAKAAAPKEPIPAKYNTSSDLVFTVRDGAENVLNVDIP
jgi:hypothetical protein